ncbi:ABC transporter ATP-binding protein [Myxosarcina sp. GI1]|uniref:ABC transporter ATP-binding protein n=1 Tax=Myxosarcina sp. GI1 TaxID=1541065 RepID=UPI00055F6FA3|nr:ABC transporter ATP-binding protein [Myxosarcina sp. GI1]
MTSTIEHNISQKFQDNDIVLKVESVSKKFCRDLKRSLFYGVQDITSDLLGLRENSDKLRPSEFWALDNVSFELRRGESVGLIGKNGSGKSTLLRIIAGLIKPDLGTVRVKGRVAPLIALGAGFNPILTGRENIYANMSILGLSKKEIDERFDDVVEFAEISEAIDSPVQTYSSGMAARLGFASAIYTEPDILLIDEVLAVGDIRFRRKCQRKLVALLQAGKSFILVSHNSQSILNICQSAAYLSKGNLIDSGDTHEIITKYEEELFFIGGDKAFGSMFLPEKLESESLGLDVTSVQFKDNSGNTIETLTSGESVTLSIGCKVHKASNNINLFIAIKEMMGENDLVLHLSSFNDGKPLALPVGKHQIQLHLPYLGLKPGLYNLDFSIKEGSICGLDKVPSFRFKVIGRESMSRCLFYQPREWGVLCKR